MLSKEDISLVLNTIDVLRNRKARPDHDKITRKLKKSLGVQRSSVCLEQMVDDGYLIKVEYKGSYSYKDSSKWTKGRVAGHIINSERLSAKMQQAVKSITDAHLESADASIYENTGEPRRFCRKGATPEDIENWFKNNKDPTLKCVLKDDAMFDVLTREVEMNKLQKNLEDGTYFVGKVKIEMPLPYSKEPKKVTKDKNEKPSSTISSDSTSKTPDEEDTNDIMPEEGVEMTADDESQRTSTRSKRKIKNKFDKNSDYEVTPFKKTKRKAVPDGPTFVKKFKPAAKVKKTPSIAERPVQSVNDSLKTEESNDSSIQTESSRPTGSLQLEDETSNSNKWAHDQAEQEPVHDHDESSSEPEVAVQVLTTTAAASLPPPPPRPHLPLSPSPSASNDSMLIQPPSMIHENFPTGSLCSKCRQAIQPPPQINECDGFEFPDMSNFTVQQVYDYIRTFANGKYAAQAEVLKEEDIDGNALMFMSREDIVKLHEKGRFALGPALKLNHLVKNIKLRGWAQYYKHD